MRTTIQIATGKQVLPWLDAVAALRIEVFRAFPYLYEGELDYERSYLATYANSAHSLFVLALDGDKLVGASTGIPLTEAEPEFQAPFIAAQVPLESVFYFGESVLQRNYRGQHLGHRFFDEREKFARSLGKSVTAFCAVERPENHPLRPTDYTPLDGFWKKRGYKKQPDMRTFYNWLDIGETTATEKPMVFWINEQGLKDWSQA